MLGARRPGGRGTGRYRRGVPTRVAVDTGPLVGPRSGIGVAVEHLVRALGELPDRVEVLPYVLSFRAPLAPGTTRLAYPASLAHRVWSRVQLPRADRRLGRPQVVHGTNYVVPPARAARLVSVYDCWFLEHPEGVHADVARAGAVLRRSIAAGAVVHCSSQATADRLRSLWPVERIEVVHLGTVPLVPPPSTAPAVVRAWGDAPFIVSVGTIERRKNVPTLIDAFELLAAIDPEIRLVVAGGPGNDSEAVELRRVRLPEPIRSRVHVLGRVDAETKSWLAHRARVLAYPSLDEGFGFPILEAMGAGTPVVASDVGSIPEVAGDAARLVRPDDPVGLAAALLAMHHDDDLRSSARRLGLERAAHFDWRTTATRFADLYDALAMEHRR